MNHDSNNIMVILSSPSGVGKTTIRLKRLKNPFYPPKNDLLTSGSLSNSFPDPSNLFCPVTNT